MKVSELREALKSYDGDDTVVVGDTSNRDMWSAIGYVEQAAVKLGVTTEKVVRIASVIVVEADPASDGDGSCDRCEHLEGVIDEIRSAIAGA